MPRAHLIHACVDPGGKGRADHLCILSVGRPFRCHVAAVKKQPRRTILHQVAWPEICSQQPQAALAPQINLPQPIPHRIEALHKEGILRALRADMGHPPGVNRNTCRGCEAGQRETIHKSGS